MKQIKKLCCVLLIALLCTFMIPVVFSDIMPTGYTVQAASKIRLNTTKKTMIKGTTYTLKIKGTSKKVKWSTTNKKVAKVNSKGKVTAVGKGTATIKARVKGKTYSCKVKVESPSLSKKKCTMVKGTTYTLKLKGNTQKIKWSSSNKKVATVSSKGKIKAIKKGTATIKAKVGGKTYSCKVTVETPSISKTKYTMIKGTTYTLKLKGNTQKIKWSSSNKKIATVSSKGKIKAIKKGTATIKAKVGSKTYSCKVTVEAPSFAKTSISVNVASNIANPLKNTTKKITYKTSNSSIATVDSNGTVYGIKAGTSTITATVDGKNFTYSVTVKKVTSVSGWKTLCDKKYYYESGIPVTGLQPDIIDNMKCFFNVDGSLLTEFDANATFGIDVSGWQYNIDWDKVKASGVEFAIIRCGYGMDEKDQDDSYYKRNIDACKRLDIPYGIYLYSYATTIKRADSEADHALRLAKGYTPTLGIWYDIEDDSTSSISNNLRTEIINTFCEKIQKNGYKTGVYANLNWLNNKIENSIKDKYPIWVAQYYSKCEYKGNPEIWQFTSSGTINGIKGNVDCNIMFQIPKNE